MGLKDMFKKGNRGKTKEQLIADRKAMEEARKMRTTAREKIYPALQGHGLTLQQVQNKCNIVVSVIRTKQNEHWKDMEVAALDLDSELINDKHLSENDRALYTDLLGAINTLPIGEGIKMLEGFSRSVDTYIGRKMQTELFDGLAVEEFVAPEQQ